MRSVYPKTKDKAPRKDGARWADIRSEFLIRWSVGVSWGRKMATNRIFGGVFAGLLIIAAGVAVADSLASAKPTDFFAPGKHQFYVWCARGGDYVTVQTGTSAEDAQMKLYDATKAKGHSTCWPVWQGRVGA
jgi:hypothetical protein